MEESRMREELIERESASRILSLFGNSRRAIFKNWVQLYVVIFRFGFSGALTILQTPKSFPNLKQPGVMRTNVRRLWVGQHGLLYNLFWNKSYWHPNAICQAKPHSGHELN